MPFTKYENSGLRANIVVFGLRTLQVLFAVTILGVAADDVTIWRPDDCNVPPKLEFNLATAAITLPITLYLLFTTGPLAKTFKALPWSPWLQLGVDILLFILWVAVGALSSYTCDDVCSACTPYGLNFGTFDPDYGGYIYIDPIALCSCIIYAPDNSNNFRRRSLFSRASRGGSHSGGSGSSSLKSLEHFIAKVGLDWTMFTLVVCVLIGTIYLLWQDRRASQPQEENAETVTMQMKTAGVPTQTEAQTETQVQAEYQAQYQAQAQGTVPQYQPQAQVPVPQYQPQAQSPVPQYQPQAQSPVPQYQAQVQSPVPQYQAQVQSPVPQYQAQAQSPVPQYPPQAQSPVPQYQAQVQSPVPQYPPQAQSPVSQYQPQAQSPAPQYHPQVQGPTPQHQPNPEG